MSDIPRMFNQEATEHHIGKEIKFRERLKVLAEVETYVRHKCIANRIEFCYDCTADENTYFKTINYTTYNGLFIQLKHTIQDLVLLG